MLPAVTSLMTGWTYAPYFWWLSCLDLFNLFLCLDIYIRTLFWMMAFIVILFCLFQVLLQASADGPDCPKLVCDPRTAACQHLTYFTFGNLVCSGCNICIKYGSPVDSEGCPQMPCPDKMPPGSCYQPWVRHRWVAYGGKKCPTCESRLCHFRP